MPLILVGQRALRAARTVRWAACMVAAAGAALALDTFVMRPIGSPADAVWAPATAIVLLGSSPDAAVFARIGERGRHDGPLRYSRQPKDFFLCAWVHTNAALPSVLFCPNIPQSQPLVDSLEANWSGLRRNRNYTLRGGAGGEEGGAGEPRRQRRRR